MTPKLKGIVRYGKACCPSILFILRSWISFCQHHNVLLSDCLLWKDDVESAFPQLNIEPSSALMFATRIDDELIFINSSGLFGWPSMPMAFGVISRALERKVNSVISGISIFFCDDNNALFLRDSAFSDQALAQEAMRQVLNPSAVSSSKEITPRLVGDIIGWTIDLSNGTMRPTTKGTEKIFYAFSSVDTSRKISLKTYQCLAGLSQFYSLGIVAMTAFVAPLHKMCSAASKHNRLPSSEAKFCIEVWRIVAILLYTDPTFLNVKITAVTGHTVKENLYLSHTIVFISDASPWKLGAGLYCSTSNTLIAYTSFPILFVDPHNKYQNIREYLGMLLCLMLVRVIFPSERVMIGKWINDNKAALKWAKTAKCSSICGQAANIVVSWFQIHSGINVVESEHKAGINMGIIDDISRDVKNPDLDSIPFVNLLSPSFKESHQLLQIFKLCDSTMTGNITNHHDMFFKIHKTLNDYFNI